MSPASTMSSHSWDCAEPRRSLFVWDNGDVSYCGRTAPKGSLRFSTLAEFWNAPSVVEDVRRVAAGAFDEAGCMPTCNIRAAAQPGPIARNYRSVQAEAGAAHDPERIPVRPIYFVTSVVTSVMTSVAPRDRAARPDLPVGARPMPTHVVMQLSNYCTLGCKFCCFGPIDAREKKRNLKVMSPEVLDRVAAVYPHARRVDLLGGELFDLPFENHPLQQILPAMQSSGNRDLRVTIVTNGQHLSQRWVDFLLGFDVIDAISFSIDSVDPDVYPQIRVGGCLDNVLASVARVRDAIARRGRSEPQIRWTCVLSRQSYPGIGRLVRAARSHGVSRIDIQPMNPMGTPAYHAENEVFRPERAGDLVKLMEILAHASEIDSNRADIMAMARAYLEEIGAGAQMIDAPGVPFTAQLRSENCIGKIGRRDVVHHEFRASRNRLRSVQLCFATYGNPRNRRPVRMRLENAAGATLARGEIPATAIEDNRWVGATLSPCPLDVGSTYRLEISAPVPLLGGGSITLRCSSQAERDGAFAINGVRQDGALAIALF